MAVFQIILVLLTIAWLPGVAVLDYLGLWKRLPPLSRFLLPIPIGLAVMPAVLYLIGHLVSVSPTMACVTSFALSLALFSITRWQNAPFSDSIFPPLFSPRGKVVFFTLLVLLLLATGIVLLETTGSLRLIPAVGDYPKHDGIIHALTGSKLPPVNPFYRPSYDVPLSYYYLFHLLPAASSITGIPPANVFAVFAFLVGVSLLVVIAQWVRLRGGSAREALIAVVLLSLLGGADVIPLIHMYLTKVGECSSSFWSCWWGTVPIYATAWPGGSIKVGHFFQAMVWVPHHLTAITIILLVPLLHKMSSRKDRLWPIVALSLISLVGSSIYIALFSFAAFLIWLISWYWRDRPNRVKPNRFSIGISLILFLIVISLLALEIRPPENAATVGFSLGPALNHVFSTAAQMKESSAFWQGLNALTVLLIGIGPLFVIIFLGSLRAIWKSTDRWIRILLGASLLLGCFIRSGGHYNDFGMRTLFVSRIALSLMAATSVTMLLNNRRWFRLACVIPLFLLGALSPFHEFYGLGPYRISQQLQRSPRNQAFIEACTYLRKNTPEDSVVQGTFGRMSYLHLLSRRRNVALDHMHGSLLNVDAVELKQTVEIISRLIRNLERKEAPIIARKLEIDFLILRNHRVPASLATGFQNVFQNTHYSILKID